MLISVVVPVLNEKENISALTDRLAEILSRYDSYEILFVDDGSTDGSIELLRRLSAERKHVGYVSLSRNFGHQNALRAGITAAQGDCIIMMDGDFQHPPEVIPLFIDKYLEGFDIVSGVRDDRSTSSETPGFSKRISSRLFYRIINSLSDVRIQPGAADFRLISSRARSILLDMKEQNLFLRGILPWTGLPQTEIRYQTGKRRNGTTKYSFSKMLNLAMDGITSFSIKPLRLTSFLGAVISLLGFIYAVYALCMRLFTTKTIEGWTSLLISVLLIGGIQLLSIGILGEYVGKTFMETKGRPHYIIRESRLPRLGAEPELKTGQRPDREDRQ